MWIVRKYNKIFQERFGETGIYLFNQEPVIRDYLDPFYIDLYPSSLRTRYAGCSYWNSLHGSILVPKKFNKDFDFLTYESGPIECELYITDNNPVFYIVREKDNLYISDKIREKIWTKKKYLIFKETYVEYYIDHSHRLSSKLFPELETGKIVGIGIKIK